MIPWALLNGVRRWWKPAAFGLLALALVVLFFMWRAAKADLAAARMEVALLVQDQERQFRVADALRAQVQAADAELARCAADCAAAQEIFSQSVDVPVPVAADESGKVKVMDDETSTRALGHLWLLFGDR